LIFEVKYVAQESFKYLMTT